MAAIAMEKSFSNNLTQMIPKLVYMGVVGSGRHTLKMDRIVLAAAFADTENCLYTSVR